MRHPTYNQRKNRLSYNPEPHQTPQKGPSIIPKPQPTTDRFNWHRFFRHTVEFSRSGRAPSHTVKHDPGATVQAYPDVPPRSNPCYQTVSEKFICPRRVTPTRSAKTVSETLAGGAGPGTGHRSVRYSRSSNK